MGGNYGVSISVRPECLEAVLTAEELLADPAYSSLMDFFNNPIDNATETAENLRPALALGQN